MPYSIIIPIHNEESSIPLLLKELKTYTKNNEVLFVNDGSNDKSKFFLEKCNYIKLINLNSNSGKGNAIKEGIDNSKYNKIIITDGDLELKTSELKSLMILDKKKNINFVLGNRFNKITPLESSWSFGNFLLTLIFNSKLKTNLPDALCCAKSFYKEDINTIKIQSKGFDIDIELSSILIKKYKGYKIKKLAYKRRNKNQGKKLRIFDGFFILFRILSL